MSPHGPDDPRDGDGPADRDDRPSDAGDDGGIDWLSNLLSALEALEEGAFSGQRRSGRTSIDYDVSVGMGEDILDGSRFEGNPFSEHERSRRDRSRTTRTRATDSATDHRLTTRREDDELLVIADVPGADPDEVTVGFDDASLVVGVSGRELERIDVPWPERTAEAVFKNGVLTVRIERDDRAEGGEDDG
ncbi:Hsp20/alpha crystallin family protein [Halopiger goleimassiliensis]|uniref:Hsp20/alpha crystallin family protein n=1 Tax=Halopiger goleimassiliensis TaxID=1293048 RepID=UPI0006776E32|nr:Hsp20/alpha crystallin family protein [Halopiger goleimassiliensis]